MKTIKELANEIGVSKQAVQKRIAREPLCTCIQPYISTNQGTKYIDDAGEKLIKSAFAYNNEAPASIDVADNHVHTLISMLQHELDMKNEQIKELNARLAEANAYAAAAQALHAGTIQKQLTGGESSGEVAKRKGFFGLFRK